MLCYVWPRSRRGIVVTKDEDHVWTLDRSSKTVRKVDKACRLLMSEDEYRWTGSGEDFVVSGVCTVLLESLYCAEVHDNLSWCRSGTLGRTFHLVAATSGLVPAPRGGKKNAWSSCITFCSLMRCN